jgi:hypothetical protein
MGKRLFLCRLHLSVMFCTRSHLWVPASCNNVQHAPSHSMPKAATAWPFWSYKMPATCSARETRSHARQPKEAMHRYRPHKQDVWYTVLITAQAATRKQQEDLTRHHTLSTDVQACTLTAHYAVNTQHVQLAAASTLCTGPASSNLQANPKTTECMQFSQ